MVVFYLEYFQHKIIEKKIICGTKKGRDKNEFLNLRESLRRNSPLISYSEGLILFLNTVNLLLRDSKGFLPTNDGLRSLSHRAQ